ncbi:unnamed protein product [Pseudo-nitzschia multistriata]|uniref:Uncharacterized protein n=1 Tax=Pseudo-nitzschia multistriata TaxID=183589 RepID=A0A448ZQ63_9STRA|nr:unnamed protein product [Pseudo-nitzschia multistriata]
MFVCKILLCGFISSSIHALKFPSTKTQQLRSSAVESANSELSRRQLLLSGVTLGTIGAILLPTNPANAARAKGAAELDLEFYIRDLVNGNKKEGSISPSTNGPPVPPPRTLKGSIIPLLLNKECSPDCIPVQALIEEIEKQDKVAGRTPASKEAIAKDIQYRVNSIREKTSRSFLTKAPWNEEEISDQYYFDFTAYALWKTAAEMIDDVQNRDRFMRNIGRLLVDKLESEGILTGSSASRQQQLSKNNGVLVSSIPLVMELLNVFKTSGYCKNFRIRSSDNADAMGDDLPLFDELDDESLSMVGTSNCLVSIFEPAVLGASLQINGENSRFAPDFIGTSLAAIWEKYGGIRSTWDVFFVDPEYRPNPKDYFPNEQLLQITLNKS